MTFELRLEGGEGAKARRKAGRRVFQAEGTASAKALRQAAISLLDAGHGCEVRGSREE